MRSHLPIAAVTLLTPGQSTASTALHTNERITIDTLLAVVRLILEEE